MLKTTLLDKLDEYTQVRAIEYNTWILDRIEMNLLARVKAVSSTYYNQWTYHPRSAKMMKILTDNQLYAIFLMDTDK